jgi:glycine cleavage system H protein
MPVPADRSYSKEHEWARVQDDGIICIGITEFAQHELGDVIYVELPKQGANVTQHTQMGEIESVKAVSELFAPVSGEIVEINAAVVSAPELVNEDPYEKGWLLKIKPADQAELGNLLDAAQYDSLTT